MACVYPAGTTGGSLHGGTLFDGEAQNGFGLEFGRQLAGGGNVAWGAADRRVDRVGRVILVDTLPPTPGGMIWEFPTSISPLL